MAETCDRCGTIGPVGEDGWCDYCAETYGQDNDPGHTCETCGGITDYPCLTCPNCETGDV